MSIIKAKKKPVVVEFLQLTEETVNEVFQFITLPSNIVYVHENGTYSHPDHKVDGDKVGIVVYSIHGVATLITSGSYVGKDDEEDYIFITEDSFKNQYDLIVDAPAKVEKVPAPTPEIKTPEPTPVATRTPTKPSAKK